MKQETPEESAYKLYPIILEDDWDKNKQYRDEWINGVKYQQEQDKNKYSEEDMRIAFNTKPDYWIIFEEFIEQFKKK